MKDTALQLKLAIWTLACCVLAYLFGEFLLLFIDPGTVAVLHFGAILPPAGIPTFFLWMHGMHWIMGD